MVKVLKALTEDVAWLARCIGLANQLLGTFSHCLWLARCIWLANQLLVRPHTARDWLVALDWPISYWVRPHTAHV